MSIKDLFLTLNLQLFAEGGDSGEGATVDTAADDAPQEEGDIETSGETEEEPQEEPNREVDFENLIKGEYKDLYDAKVKGIVEKRLKNSKETIEKYNSLAPMLEMLSKKYGVDATDTEALNRAIEDDDAYYEEEAIEKGITVEQLKAIKKMERENAELKKQMQEQQIRENAAKKYSEWMDQGEALKAIYPSFDLETEFQNPQFVDLLKNNISVRTAFEVIHKDEIIGSAMQFTAQKTKEKVANDIIAKGARPAENGLGNQASAVVKRDVSQLSAKEREEYIKRSERGERITFK